jgi:heme-degrading monooxygenase HmoA
MDSTTRADHDMATDPGTGARHVGDLAAAGGAGSLVVASSLVVATSGVDALEAAFAARLRAVEDWPGFRGLQVWRDHTTPGAYTMVSWWADAQRFARYMQSSEHHASHARVPNGADGPKLVGVRRFDVVAT